MAGCGSCCRQEGAGRGCCRPEEGSRRLFARRRFALYVGHSFVDRLRKLPPPKRRYVLCCRVFGSSMPRAVLYAPRALHSSRCLHLTAGCCRRPHRRQTRHHCCSDKWRPCSSSGSRYRRCFLRRPPRRRVSARWQLFHALFKPNSVCASSFFCFPSVNTPHCISLLAMATLKLPVFCCSATLI